jgi:hypothetical protein
VSRLYVQLGRSGDILSLLPLLWADTQKGERPRLMVAKDYAPLLDGISYVEPFLFDGGAHELDRALVQAEALDPQYIVTQVNGPTEAVRDLVYKRAGRDKATTFSFAKEMWALAGRLGEWGKYPLVFDRRDKVREEALLASAGVGKRKFVLVAAEGISSPFPFKPLLLELVKRCGYQVVEVDKLGATSLYDLLALYEKAQALIAIDSAPLHLAQAVPELPVFALTRDTPQLWNGAPWRANHVWYCRYSDFPHRAVEMLDTLKEVKRREAKNAARIVHVYNAADGLIKVPNKYWDCLPILKGMAWTGPNGFPRVRDLLKMALQRLPDGNGWVCLTRSGVEFTKHADETLMLSPGPCYAYRLRGGEFVPVLDLFSASPEWWAKRLELIPPELYLANDYFWSKTLGAIFKADRAQDITGIVTRDQAPKAPPTELSESTKVNRDAYDRISEILHVTGNFPPASEQLSALALDASVLPPFSYNPSLGRFNGKMIMTYRYHADGDRRTRLGMARLNGSRLEEPRDLQLTGHSLEDARLFTFHGETWFSWVESDIGAGPKAHCVVKYGRLDFFGKVTETHQVKIGSNTGQHMEKNWCFFESDENLFCVYRAQPDYTVLQLHGSAVINEYKTPEVRWAYGEIRGGCVVPYGEKSLLRLFHSRTESIEPRYYVGALIMERRPPFNVVAISKRPVLYGAELPDCGKYPYKARVVFPGGALPFEKDWLLAVGLNDCACGVVKVSEKDLNL